MLNIVEMCDKMIKNMTYGCDNLKKNKKFLSIVLSVIMVILSFFMIEVSAASTGNLGTNETNITWSFDESTGVLTVNGSGEMKSLNNSID